MKEEDLSSEKIFNLDNQAKELGIGGKTLRAMHWLILNLEDLIAYYE